MFETVAVYVVCTHLITSLDKPLNCKLTFRTFVRFSILKVCKRFVKCLIKFYSGQFSSFVVRSRFVFVRFFPAVVARFCLSAFRQRVGYCVLAFSSVGLIGNVGISELYRVAFIFRFYSAIACRVCSAFGITSLHQHIFVL